MAEDTLREDAEHFSDCFVTPEVGVFSSVCPYFFFWNSFGNDGGCLSKLGKPDCNRSHLKTEMPSCKDDVSFLSQWMLLVPLLLPRYSPRVCSNRRVSNCMTAQRMLLYGIAFATRSSLVLFHSLTCALFHELSNIFIQSVNLA